MRSIVELLGKLKKEKRTALIVIAGALIILLVLFSEFSDKGDEKNIKPETTEPKESFDYAEDIEKKLTEIISSIEGAGKVKVMVTLESSQEKVYASDSQSQSDSLLSDGEKDSNSQRKESYVVIKSDSGDETGLILKIMQPRVRGVAVVCEGADSAKVKKNITDTVTAVLDIKLSNVSVTKGF